MDNFLKGKSISFIGEGYVPFRAFVQAHLLGANYVAGGMRYIDWEKFKSQHEGVKFDLFVKVDKDASSPQNDPLQGHLPDVPVVPYSAMEALVRQGPPQTIMTQLETLVREQGYQFYINNLPENLLAEGRIHIEQSEMPPKMTSGEWQRIMLDHVSATPAILDRMRGAVPIDLLPDKLKMAPCQVAGLDEPWWLFTPESMHDMRLQLYVHRDRSDWPHDERLRSLLHSMLSEAKVFYGCLCSSSRYEQSTRLHWMAWTDPIARAIEGLWFLDQSHAKLKWEDEAELQKQRKKAGLPFSESLDPGVEGIYKYFQGLETRAWLSVFGDPRASKPIDEDYFQGKTIYEGQHSSFNRTSTLYAMGAKRVLRKPTAAFDLMIGIRHLERRGLPDVPNVPWSEVARLARERVPDLPALFRALEGHGFEIRNPSDEGSAAKEIFELDITPKPEELQAALLGYLQGSEFVQKWLSRAYAPKTKPERGFDPVEIQGKTGYLRWIKDGDEYRIKAERQLDDEDDEVSLDISDFSVNEFWTHRVLAHFNASPSKESVDGLIIAAGIDRRTGKFNGIAVSRVWT